MKKETKNELAFSIATDLDSICGGMSMVEEKLFGNLTPSEDYTIDYKQWASLFHILNNRLWVLSGKLSLLVGNEGNGGVDYEFQQLQTLMGEKQNTAAAG